MNKFDRLEKAEVLRLTTIGQGKEKQEIYSCFSLAKNLTLVT